MSVNRNEENVEGELKNYLQRAGLENIEIKPIKASVEDYFIKLLK